MRELFDPGDAVVQRLHGGGILAWIGSAGKREAGPDQLSGRRGGVAKTVVGQTVGAE